MIKLALRDARRLSIVAQGLHKRKPFGTGASAVLRCIEQLGYVQIDTISVINRSHHHTLWTRIPSYAKSDLDALQREGKVLEYWAHAAAYLPMRDYRYCLPYMHAVASGQKHVRTRDPRSMQAVLDRIRAEGPLKSQDFETPSQRGKHWGWNWKPAKIALEQLFIEGKLISSRREGFQKVYDLPERVLPSDVDTRMPTAAELHSHLIRTAIAAHGLVTVTEICYLRKGIKADVQRRLREMEEAGEVVRVGVVGSDQVHYSTANTLRTLEATRVSGHVHLLSPFDNLVIQRKRLRRLFDSHYQIECFLPPAKRQYGYYCLPIVHGTEIIGRLDPKADRRAGELIIKALFLERPLVEKEKLATKLARQIEQLAAFNQCPRIIFRPHRGDQFEKLLSRQLARA